jgi:cellobiose-specific phosphotransferase system component IIC
VLSGRFTLSTYFKAVVTALLGFCLLWTFIAALVVLARNPPLWWFPLHGVVVLGALVTFVWLLKGMSRKDIAWLSTVIQDSLSHWFFVPGHHWRVAATTAFSSKRRRKKLRANVGCWGIS